MCETYEWPADFQATVELSDILGTYPNRRNANFPNLEPGVFWESDLTFPDPDTDGEWQVTLFLTTIGERSQYRGGVNVLIRCTAIEITFSSPRCESSVRVINGRDVDSGDFFTLNNDWQDLIFLNFNDVGLTCQNRSLLVENLDVNVTHNGNISVYRRNFRRGRYDCRRAEEQMVAARQRGGKKKTRKQSKKSRKHTRKH